MIENIAIIAIAFLSQLGAVSGVQNNPSNLLNRFIKEESVKENIDFQKSNFAYYQNNLSTEKLLQPLPYRKNNGKVEINSESAIAFDVGTDAVLYSKDSNKKLPIASLTKIMTALIVLEKNDLNEIVTVSQKAFKVEGKKESLTIGEKITVESLLKMMFVSSNNIAATALAEHTGGNLDDFVVLMNRKAELLGLNDTVFYNPTGLDQENNNISTAYDISQLVDYSLNSPLIWEYSRIQYITLSSLDGKIKHRIKNTNFLLGKFKNITGGKTGYTIEAGECLLLIIGEPKDNHRVITVVLNAEDRFLETERLVRWVFESYKW